MGARRTCGLTWLFLRRRVAPVIVGDQPFRRLMTPCPLGKIPDTFRGDAAELGLKSEEAAPRVLPSDSL